MHIDESELSQRMVYFEKVCKDNNIKLTSQRKEIFREVAQTVDHPDARIVFQRVRSRLPNVSLDTVYRTLWMLEDLQLINTLGSHREGKRFDANLTDHHHFVCSECGLTLDFDYQNFNQLRLPEAVKLIGIIKKTHVEVQGICMKCSTNQVEKTN